MKFAYFDESGDGGDGGSDVFVMAGLLIDAFKLRKYTAEFDQLLRDLLGKDQNSPRELKTKAFINGKKKWSRVEASRRKEGLRNICDLAVSCSKIFAIGFSFTNFYSAVGKAGEELPFGREPWVAAAIFIGALIQKKMQKEKKNKGLTVLIFDDNKMFLPKVSNLLYTTPAWFDGLYQQRRGNKNWTPVKPENRFDQIINSAFAMKAEHSSLIQVSDAVSYVYRRHLELMDEDECWEGEKEYYQTLAIKLDKKREYLGRTPRMSSFEFYDRAKHDSWRL